MGRSRLFYGWVIVFAAAVGLLFGGAPIIVYSFGVFLRPMAQHFHAGRGAVSLAFTLHNFVSAFCAPFYGRLADRLGARKVVVPAFLVLAATLLLALAMGTALWQLYAFYLVLGVATVGTSPILFGVVISRWFDRRRGLALGLMLIGAGMGSIIVPALMQYLIATLGWRAAYAIWGSVVLVAPTIIVGKLLAEWPAEKGLTPDGVAQGTGTRLALEHIGLEWTQIWRTKTFWALVSAFMLAGASVHACVLHLPALLSDRGMTPHQIAIATAALGAALAIGRSGSGYLLDRWFAPYVSALIFLGSALGMAVLWTGVSGPLAVAGAAMAGLGMGAEADIIGFLTSRYFGLRSLGTAVGFTFGSFILAGGVGGLLMGAGFDRTGSYRIPLAGFFLATMVAVGLFTTLGPYKYEAQRERDEAKGTAA